MKTWVERIRRDDEADGGRGLWLRGRQLGDWLALDREDGDTQNPFGATDLPYTPPQAFYYYSASLTAKAAKALGYEADQKEYQAHVPKNQGGFPGGVFQPGRHPADSRHPNRLWCCPCSLGCIQRAKKTWC